jgi:hypothetical protein
VDDAQHKPGCFVERGVNPAKVTTAVEIVTSGQMQLAFSNIAYVRGQDSDINIDC